MSEVSSKEALSVNASKPEDKKNPTEPKREG
jgi:hypothetical protein